MNFLERFARNTQISNIVKIPPVGASLFMLTEGQTELMKIVVAFRNFSKAVRKSRNDTERKKVKITKKLGKEQKTRHIYRVSQEEGKKTSGECSLC